ncbi:transketolase, partial [bacterium]|nr:transketolase [bacterium]
EEEIALTKQALGWPYKEPFTVPDDVRDVFKKAAECGAEAEREWNRLLSHYKKEHKDLAAEWHRLMRGELPNDWRKHLLQFKSSDKPAATRSVSGKVMNALASDVHSLFGGSADLAPSTKTYLNNFGDFSADNYSGRNLHFGIREHAMGACMNGIALTAPLQVFGSTFLVFSDYMRPSIRLAAMMSLKVIYVFTHDSIGVGEDGPTHQPVEHLAALRAIPNLIVIRPADAKETVAAWKFVLEHKDGPVALVLSRQSLPILDIEESVVREGVRRGGYIVHESKKKTPQLLLLATGSEVHLTIKAAEKLHEESIATRVVSLPSRELFLKQPKSYQDEVLPPSITARLAIEAGVSQGWERFVDSNGAVLAMETFGASAPAGKLFEHFGFTVENIVNKARALL